MITTLKFVLSYLFATTVFSASLFKICRNYKDSRGCCINSRKNIKLSYFSNSVAKSNVCLKILSRVKSECWTLFVYDGSLILFCILVLYMHCIAILFLYSLLIGKGSTISTGPLAVISLFPSILVSGVAWIVKRFTLDETKDTVQPSQEAKSTIQRLKT